MGNYTVNVTGPDIEQARFSIRFAIERANGDQEALIENLIETIAAKNAAIRQVYQILHEQLTNLPASTDNPPPQGTVYITSGRVVRGDIVRTITVKDGWQHNGLVLCRELAHKHLKPDTEYVVDDVEVGSWLTDVYLKDFPGISFNSVFFNDEVIINED